MIKTLPGARVNLLAFDCEWVAAHFSREREYKWMDRKTIEAGEFPEWTIEDHPAWPDLVLCSRLVGDARKDYREAAERNGARVAYEMMEPWPRLKRAFNEWRRFFLHKHFPKFFW